MQLRLLLEPLPRVRLTIPAREILAAHAALISVEHTPDGPRYRIVAALVPDDDTLVLVWLDIGELAIRRTDEPAWPGEIDDDIIGRRRCPICGRCGTHQHAHGAES